MSDETLNKETLEAALVGDAERLRALIGRGADVNHDYLTDSKYTVLGAAVMGANQECVRLLLASGARVNQRGANGESPAITAAMLGHDACLELLIGAGADVNAAIENYYTAALREVKQGHLPRDVLQALGSEYYHPPVNEGETAALLAAQNGHPRCLRLLIQAGADVNAPDVCGRTPLIATAGFMDRLAVMDRKCGEAQAQDESRLRRPYCAKLPCVALLLQAGARLNLTYEHGLNALEAHIAFSQCRDKRQVKALLCAAGEVVRSASITRRGYWGAICHVMHVGNRAAHHACAEFHLKHLCRETIRSHLLHLDPHVHLFGRVPQLGLPPALQCFLLYNQSLESLISIV